jgi:plastocyanin
MKHSKILILICFFVLIPVFTSGQTLHIVEVTDFDFIPMNIDISVGDTVEWQWIEGTHTTTSDSTSGQNVWDAPIDAANPTFRFVITASGVHSYYCTPHLSLGMVGTITATPVSGISYVSNPVNEFLLNQNYPNPFNPSTTINFSIPKASKVAMEVFNSIGEKVETLVDRELSAGNYNFEWNASNLTSGIYFYKLTSGDFVETKKMILLR